jgi:hypothetical protein
MDAEIILKVKTTSKKTIDNFGYYSKYINGMMENEGISVVIEQIQDGALLFFLDKEAYILFHERVVDLMGLLPRENNFEKFNKIDNVVLKVSEIKMNGMDKKTWSQLMAESYGQIYKKVEREITETGCILKYTGELNDTLRESMT